MQQTPPANRVKVAASVVIALPVALLHFVTGPDYSGPFPVFNADTSWSYLVQQVEFGPRVPGTDAHRACGNWLAERLAKRLKKYQLVEYPPGVFNFYRLASA